MKFDFELANSDLGKISFETIEAELRTAHRYVCNGGGKGEEFLGWRDLPLIETKEEEKLTKIEQVADLIRKKSDVFVVIGIGGSYLGAKAVINALQPAFKSKSHKDDCEILYAGHNLSEDYMCDLLEYLNHKEFSLCVISKSGTTTEPAIAFRLLRNALERKYGKKEAKDRIIAITDESKGALRKMCLENGYESFVIKDDIGGRFSVLSPVGLVPVAVAGLDIKALLCGAKIMRDNLMNDVSLSNPSWKYAAIRNLLYRNGKKIEALVSYEPALQYFSAWWQQLYGESEGKELKGLFPIGLNNTTDLHSLGQYVQEGERLMFETVLHVEKSKRSIAIPFEENDLDGLNYLTKYSLLQVNHIAEQGTRKAHLDGGISQFRIILNELKEEEIGKLIYFFEFSCALSAYLLGVNPFDQPGVEAYKKNMFTLLGKTV
jgi:glucose-6-phosphate isomerase